MPAPWSFLWWYKIELPKQFPPRGIITTYEGISLFLTDKFIIGINDGALDYFGPAIKGLEVTPWIFYGLSNDGKSITLYLNGERVMEVSQGILVFALEQFYAEPGNKGPRPITESDLSPWIIRRSSTFKLKQETSEQFRILDVEEQKQQLSKRIVALEDLLKAYQSGKSYFLEDITANLRSLIFYKVKSGNYDPLLLRLAAFNNLPLPIYLFPLPMDDEPLVYDETHLKFASYGFASCEPVTPWTRKADFQEFLEAPTLAYEQKQISPLELLEQISTKQSTAHFDQTISITVEKIANGPTFFASTNTIEYFIISLAKIVINLGHFILQH